MSFFVEPLETRRLLAAQAFVTHTGTLVVKGTDDADVITIKQTATGVSLETSGSTIVTLFTRAEVRRVLIEAGGGDDQVNIFNLKRPATVAGGGGDDVLVGSRACTLIGGGGNDKLVANAAIIGTFTDGMFESHLLDPRPSLLSGGKGNDTLVAGGPDTVVGGEGRDVFAGSLKSHETTTGPVGIAQLLNDQQDLTLSGVEALTIRFKGQPTVQVSSSGN